ncbi:MAG: SCO family protein [Hyphomonadaceae bacterium]
MRLGIVGLVCLVFAVLSLWAMPSGSSAQQTRWRADYFPNVVLTDHNGRRVRFYDDLIRDKVVAINFVYTDCNEVCPLDIAHMRRVQEILGDRVGRDIHLYSISINPDRDTPATLRRVMRTYDVGPGWTFLTGSQADVDLLQRRLGLSVPESGRRLEEHDTSIVMGNERTAQWIRRSSFESPFNIADILVSRLSNYANRANPDGPRVSYAAAGEIVDTSRGAYLFRTRCQACHTIGGGDRLGPDLAGVAGARNHAWLSRWIREPDEMIAERDPIAISLLQRYRNLQMPNLSLGESDAEEIIEYMRRRDAALAAEPRPQH